jgi:hypothetical protein
MFTPECSMTKGKCSSPTSKPPMAKEGAPKADRTISSVTSCKGTAVTSCSLPRSKTDTYQRRLIVRSSSPPPLLGPLIHLPVR